MDAWNSLEIPGSLQEGQRYYLRQARGDGQAAELAPVTFLAYTSCPAAVIVRLADNTRQRCERDELLSVVFVDKIASR